MKPIVRVVKALIQEIAVRSAQRGSECLFKYEQPLFSSVSRERARMKSDRDDPRYERTHVTKRPKFRRIPTINFSGEHIA